MIEKLKKLYSIAMKKNFFLTLLKYKVAASVEHSAILAFLSKYNIQTVIDIGANRGQFSLMARYFFPSARVFSFEPLSEPASKFRLVFKNDPLVVLYEMAIGQKTGQTNIHVSMADDSSSLLPITKLQNELYSGTGEKEVRTIMVKPLNKVLVFEDIKSPALLKMDVQGFEKEALQGCSELLPYFSFIYVECSFVELYRGQELAHDVINFLSQNGFDLAGVYNMSYDCNGLAIQGDFLFIHKFN
jgi:FkbM family methyltransferase